MTHPAIGALEIQLDPLVARVAVLERQTIEMIRLMNESTASNRPIDNDALMRLFDQKSAGSTAKSLHKCERHELVRRLEAARDDGKNSERQDMLLRELRDRLTRLEASVG